MRQPFRFFPVFLMAIVLFGAAAAFAQETGAQSYTVERGDTLDGIAAVFDVQTVCLAEANDLDDPGEIKPGQVLLISFECPLYDGLDFVTNPRDGDSGASGAAGQGGGGDAATASLSPSAGDDTYRVERGDTLDTIGQALNKSVVSIRLANELSPRDPIMPGTELVIPGDAPAYGQFPALVNPNASAANQELGQGGGGPNAGPGDQVYVVQPLDMLDLIGAQFDVQVACIAQGNNLENPSVLYPGQTLVIQANCPRYDGAAFVENPRGE